MSLKKSIKACQICKDFLPHSPNPIFAFNRKSRILIIGQAPGSVVNEKGVPFDDRSGETLRHWFGVTREQFYNPDNFAIVPMGFCYPGKGKSGDLPPRKECTEAWHTPILNSLKNQQLSVLIGTYAQKHYLGKRMERNLTETVKEFHNYIPHFFPIVHPSPLNFKWHTKNPWFMEEVVPILQYKIKKILNA